MVSPKNVVVKIYSVTGALVASYYNNTERGENLKVVCNELRIGGLDKFSFTIPSTTPEPLFNDMECQIWVDGVKWYSGFSDIIPSRDNSEPIIEITGQGFFHKLKVKTINRTYSAQTLDAIVKSVASNELGTDINVYYNVAKIDVPALSGISMNFEDQDLMEVFSELGEICNYQYSTQQYTWGVDEEKELYFRPVSNDQMSHLFEGYHYQNPEVGQLSGKMVNQILAYRTTAADSKATEYVATYSDSSSIELNGLSEKKITFPNYIDTTTIANICQSVLEKNSQPVDRVEINDLNIVDKFDIGFYGLSNRREKYFVKINDMEDITDWDLTGLNNTTVVISSEEVFTGRRAMKLVTSAGAEGDMLSYDLPVPVRFPDIFRSFVLLQDIFGSLTIKLIDSNNNTVDIDFNKTGDFDISGLISEWFMNGNSEDSQGNFDGIDGAGNSYIDSDLNAFKMLRLDTAIADTYTQLMTSAEADTVGVIQSYSMWFRSGLLDGSGMDVARIIGRDASDYWAVVLDQSVTTSVGMDLAIYIENERANSTVAVITDTEWHFTCLQLNESTGDWEFWLDGVLLDSGSNYIPTGLDKAVVMGCNTEDVPSPTSNRFDGDYQQVRLYNKFLSQAEITWLNSLYLDPNTDWIKRLVPVSLLLDTDDIIVDYDLSTSDFMTVDYDISINGNLTVDTLLREGVTDIVRVEIGINTNVPSVMYVDALSVEANTYAYRNIILEEIEYDLSKSYIANAVFGTKIDSLVDEIKGEVKEGNIALSVFSKQ